MSKNDSQYYQNLDIHERRRVERPEMKCCPLLLLIIVISDSTGDSEAAKILGAFHFNGKSHFMTIQPLLKGLAARGHQVYVLGHIPLKNAMPNYTDISLEGSVPGVFDSLTVTSALEFGQYFTLLNFFYQTVTDICQVVLEHPKVQDLIKGKDTFDLVITEVLGPDCMNAFSYRFNAPLVSIISSVILPWGNDRVGNPDHPAYIPNYFVPYTQHMTFGQRFTNTVLTELLKLGLYIFAELPAERILKKSFGEDIPPLSELKQRTSLILVNSHFSLNYPRPTVPGFVEVGGIHIQSNGILPKDIKTFLDEAEEGVIYFSLGTLVRGETLPEDKLQVFISVFSELPQRILWKMDKNISLPNVKTSKWFPQFDIMSHPNVRVFISHGGLLGTQEAVHAGVPIVGIPLFADQYLNVRNCMTKGIAVMVSYDAITKESLSNALKTVLHNSSYRQNAQQLSRLFRDRPHTPLETAIFWTEYVIRHGGAPQLRSAALDLTWYQYLLLDVTAVIVLCTALLLGAVYVICRKIISMNFGSTSKKLKRT